ncbi:hypothetical protein ALP10_200114 [Pseudomonas syringae pv. helianthi]|uniref:Uncharacterized protein n=1 Tax=Pseudomonas syringae pv. helianthi TaxID=251654 RepID=A0A3M6CMA7_9PSED|nr:hypothetical protein ALP10_200114 [Pseudomonas syringae pv. helianthi]
MKLCASRAFWLVAYPSQGHEMLFDARIRRAVEAFEAALVNRSGCLANRVACCT